jgi:hypothetical protein
LPKLRMWSESSTDSLSFVLCLSVQTSLAVLTGEISPKMTHIWTPPFFFVKKEILFFLKTK